MREGSEDEFPRDEWSNEDGGKSAAGKGEPVAKKKGSSSAKKTSGNTQGKKKHTPTSTTATSDSGKSDKTSTKRKSMLRTSRPQNVRSRPGTRSATRMRKEKAATC